MAREEITGLFPTGIYQLLQNQVASPVATYVLNPFTVPPQPKQIWSIYSITITAAISLAFPYRNNPFQLNNVASANIYCFYLGKILAGMQMTSPGNTDYTSGVLPPVGQGLIDTLYDPYSDSGSLIYLGNPSDQTPNASVTIYPPYPAQIIAGMNPALGVWILPSLSANVPYLAYQALNIAYTIAYDNGL